MDFLEGDRFPACLLYYLIYYSSSFLGSELWPPSPAHTDQSPVHPTSKPNLPCPEASSDFRWPIKQNAGLKDAAHSPQCS